MRAVSTGKKRALQMVEISNDRRFNWLEVEFDSGADPTTITHEQFKAYYPDLPLLKTKVMLTNFDGSPIESVIGVVKTKIQTNGRVHLGKLHVVDITYPTVLGWEENFSVTSP